MPQYATVFLIMQKTVFSAQKNSADYLSGKDHDQAFRNWSYHSTT